MARLTVWGIWGGLVLNPVLVGCSSDSPEPAQCQAGAECVAGGASGAGGSSRDGAGGSGAVGGDSSGGHGSVNLGGAGSSGNGGSGNNGSGGDGSGNASGSGGKGSGGSGGGKYDNCVRGKGTDGLVSDFTDGAVSHARDGRTADVWGLTPGPAQVTDGVMSCSVSRLGDGCGITFQDGECYDARHYYGVRLRLRSTEQGAVSVRVYFRALATVPVEEGGTCELKPPDECYASFETFVSVPTTWTDFELPWTEFTQPKWTVQPLPTYPFERELLSLQLIGQQDWIQGIEVDEVELY